MFDCIVFNVGRYFCRTILTCANDSFINKRVIFESLKLEEKLSLISLPDHLEDKYFDRILKMLENGYIKDAFTNVQSFNEHYRSKLINHCTENKLVLTNSKDDCSSLNLCAQFGYADIARFIMLNNKDLLNKSNKSGAILLQVACKYGFCDIVNLLLKHTSNINITDENTLTPLHICCLHGHKELAEILIRKGADINICSSIHGTPIFVASSNQRLEVVDALLSNGADINKGLENGVTPLHDACANNKKDTVNLLLKQNIEAIDINSVDERGRTPLYITCREGYYDLAEILILNKSTKAAVNKSDSNGLAPIHKAVFGEHFSLTELLLLHHAAVDKICKKGHTPLYLACQKGNLNILKLLLRYRADINGRSEMYTRTPLYAAYKNNHYSIVKHLLQHIKETTKYMFLFIACFVDDIDAVKYLLQNKNVCIDIDYMKYGKTALCIACDKGNAKLVELLLQHNPNINIYSKTGWTPLCLACKNGDKTSVELLTNHKASVNITTKLHLTPLFISCLFSHTGLIDTLLHQKASVNDGDLNGWTPLKISCYLGLTDVVDKLLNSKATVNSEEMVAWKAERKTRRNVHRHPRVTRMVSVHKKKVNNNFKIKQTPLCISIWQSNEAAVNVLLDSGADVNQGNASDDLARTFDECESYVKSRLLLYKTSLKETFNEVADLTPLQIACYKNKTDVIKRLLRNKAAMNFFSPTGIVTTDPLNYRQFVDIMRNNAKTYPPVTPLSIAINTGQISIIRKLIEHGAKINLPTSTGCTPLHLAIQKYDETHDVEMIQLLLDKKYNCEVNLYMQGVGTPLYLACSYNQLKIVQMLIRKKANVNKVGDGGQTALQIACAKGSKDIVKILLDNGAELHSEGQRGPNPLELTKTHYLSIYALLMKWNVPIKTRTGFGNVHPKR